MSIIKHFQEGNQDQEYEGLHSKWKEPDEQAAPPDSSIAVYNLAIKDAIKIVEANYDSVGASFRGGDFYYEKAMEQLKNLIKK